MENHKKGLKDNYWRLVDFLSQISKLSYFNLLDLPDFLMHLWFPVSYFDVATLGVRWYSRTPVLAICASFQATSFNWQFKAIDHNSSHKPVSALSPQ